MSLSDGQPSYNEQNSSKITITPTATRSERSDNPAAVLRSLLSRLPAHPPSSTKSYALSVQDNTEQERESDFDTVSESNDAPPSIAQESLKHIFSNALRDPGNTPQKGQRRKRNSIDSIEVEGNPRVEKERKGKQRSVSDDEVENASQSINRHDIRLKSTSPQPFTMEFLHERFSNSHKSRTTEYDYKDDSSSDTATILHNLNSLQATPPAATSTPQQSQSLRLSTSSSFQFHSNLLDRDSEMRKAIEDMDDSFDDSEDPTTHAFNSSSKALQTSPVPRHHSPKSSFKPKPLFSSNYEYTPQSTPVDSPLDIPERNHPHWQPLTPITSFSKGSKLEPKTPAAWEYTSQPNPVDSPLDIPERNSGFPTPIASSSKGSKLDPKTPAAPGAWEDTTRPVPVDSPLDIPERNHPQPLTPVALFSKGSKLEPKTPAAPGAWEDTTRPTPVDSPLDIPEGNSGLLTPIPSFSKGSKLDPKTPAAPGAWLATPHMKKSILKVRFETTFPSPPHRQKSPKSPKIRVLDAFGREQEPASDLSNLESDSNSSPSALRVVDAMGHEVDEESHVEDTEAAATPNNSTVSRGELLSGIRNGLDDLVVGINDLDKDDQPLSIDHDRVEELNTISSRARGLREKLYSLVDSSRHSSLRVSSTKASWFPANPKVYLLLIILQLSLTWLVYRISINRAQELWLNRYYDPFNPELQVHLYISKTDTTIHALRSESESASRTTVWSSLVGRIWDGWIYFIGNMQFFFWPESAVLRYDNAWTPT